MHQDWSTVQKQPESSFLPIVMALLMAIQIYMQVLYHRMTEMLHETQKSYIPSDGDIEATLHPYVYQEIQTLPVTINNVTTQIISVYPKGLICEIKPVSIEDTETQTDSKKDLKAEDAEEVLSRIKFQKYLSGEELSQCRELRICTPQQITSTAQRELPYVDQCR